MGGAQQQRPQQYARDPNVIDGEFEEVPRDPNAPPSGWTKH
jgi:UPF0716 protein FxsA